MSNETPGIGFVNHLRWKYDLRPSDVEVSPTRGYWKVRKPCPGGPDCRHAFRGAIGPCEGGGQLTISYSEHGERDPRTGQFVKPYREWDAQRASAPTEASNR